MDGAAGRVATTGEVKEAKEFPIRFFAVTRNSYALPALKPVTVAEVVVDTPSVMLSMFLMLQLDTPQCNQ
jgi:hypothetical protein